jgi:hypothetical protein
MRPPEAGARGWEQISHLAVACVWFLFQSVDISVISSDLLSTLVASQNITRLVASGPRGSTILAARWAQRYLFTELVRSKTLWRKEGRP